MFAKKIGMVVIGAVLAMFMIGQVAASTAWAQSWDDLTADDAASESQPAALLDATGTYSGSINDHRFGPGNITASITQTGKVLSGEWSADVANGVGGKLSGKINAKGDVKFTLKIKGKGSCGLHAIGTFENGDEISAVYHAVGCGGSDHGHLDMTD